MAEHANPAWVTKLETHFGAPLPSPLVQRYLTGDGEPKDAFDNFRLLSADEVIELEKTFSATRNLWGGVPMFEDDNGNYAVVYLTGPLIGRVSFIEDGDSGQVVFRSVHNFLSALAQLPEDDGWLWMTVDYFHLSMPFDGDRHLTPAEREADLLAAARLREAWDAAQKGDDYDAAFDGTFFRHNLVVLTPFDRYEDLRSFWSGPLADPFAVAWLGFAGDDAIEPIEEVLREGNHTSAYLALTLLGTERARAALFAAAGRCSPGHVEIAAHCLIALEIPVRHEVTGKGEHRYLFQTEPNGLWQIVGSTAELPRREESEIACGMTRTRQRVRMVIAFTEGALDELRRQLGTTKDPAKVWVLLSYISILSQQYGRRLAIQATNLLPPTALKLETPQLRLAIDRETWEELSAPASLPAPGLNKVTFKFDYVVNEQGEHEFVRRYR